MSDGDNLQVPFVGYHFTISPPFPIVFFPHIFCYVASCSRPSEDRTIPLSVIAKKTKLSTSEVECLLMKSLSVTPFPTFFCHKISVSCSQKLVYFVVCLLFYARSILCYGLGIRTQHIFRWWVVMEQQCLIIRDMCYCIDIQFLSVHL